MKAVILAAGVGSRFGRPLPKALAKLPDGESILGRQIRIFKEFDVHEVYVVVGYKKNVIMETLPDVFYRYNPYYATTNTSKSLLMGISDLSDDIVWTNGDIVFDEQILSLLLESEGCIVTVNRADCGEEEVKYRTNPEGNIVEISKSVVHPEGEALGLNRINRANLPLLKTALATCDDQDYFERGLGMLLDQGVVLKPLDVSDYRCIEVDFEEDWRRALKMFG